MACFLAWTTVDIGVEGSCDAMRCDAMRRALLLPTTGSVEKGKENENRYATLHCADSLI